MLIYFCFLEFTLFKVLNVAIVHAYMMYFL
jgi:nitrate reductase NapE component